MIIGLPANNYDYCEVMEVLLVSEI